MEKGKKEKEKRKVYMKYYELHTWLHVLKNFTAHIIPNLEIIDKKRILHPKPTQINMCVYVKDRERGERERDRLIDWLIELLLNTKNHVHVFKRITISVYTVLPIGPQKLK